MITVGAALVLLFGFLLAGLAAYLAGGNLDERRRDRWDAECREFGCHEPPYDWAKEPDQ